MKGIVALSFLFIVLLSVASAKPVDTKDEEQDIDELLKNRRLVVNYIRCCLGEVTCTPEGQKLKDLLPGAINSECADCTQEQKDSSKKVIAHLIKKEGDLWKKLELKYDPTGVFKSHFCEKVKAAGEDIC